MCDLLMYLRCAVLLVTGTLEIEFLAIMRAPTAKPVSLQQFPMSTTQVQPIHEESNRRGNKGHLRQRLVGIELRGTRPNVTSALGCKNMRVSRRS